MNGFVLMRRGSDPTRVAEVVDERGDERGHELQVVDHLRVDLVLQDGGRALHHVGGVHLRGRAVRGHTMSASSPSMFHFISK